MSLRLSVLDQSINRAADQASRALHETLQMARWCESLEYKRFWVSEHHAFPTIAGSAPEVLLAAIGAATSTIRIGSGGIMLPHYSAYKVAEVFSVLANLYPDRIDLGIGRAPGADMSTAVALATDGRPKFERFPQLIEDLEHYIRSDVTKPIVSPKPPKTLPIWMLGTSADSAQLAAQKGLPYNLGLFINPQAPPELTNFYKQYFKPSEQLQQAYSIITMSAFCCETEEQARLHQLTFDINFYLYVTGQRDAYNDGALLTPEQANSFPINSQLKAFIDSRSQNRAVGTPHQVRDSITKIANRYDADEVMIVTNMFNFEDRKRSFELLKDVF
jgi:luciferase family oxidoreductase group 1